MWSMIRRWPRLATCQRDGENTVQVIRVGAPGTVLRHDEGPAFLAPSVEARLATRYNAQEDPCVTATATAGTSPNWLMTQVSETLT